MGDVGMEAVWELTGHPFWALLMIRWEQGQRG